MNDSKILLSEDTILEHITLIQKKIYWAALGVACKAYWLIA